MLSDPNSAVHPAAMPVPRGDGWIQPPCHLQNEKTPGFRVHPA